MRMDNLQQLFTAGTAICENIESLDDTVANLRNNDKDVGGIDGVVEMRISWNLGSTLMAAQLEYPVATMHEFFAWAANREHQRLGEVLDNVQKVYAVMSNKQQAAAQPAVKT